MIDYLVKTRKRGLGLSLKVQPNGQIVVYAPRFTPKFIIDKFVAKNTNWIVKQKAKFKKQQLVADDEFIYLFGKKYQLKVADINQPLGGFYIVQDALVYQPSSSLGHLPQKPPKKRLEAFLKHTATDYITPRTHQLAEKMGLKFSRISFKQQKTRWGSCSAKKNLNFNWRLVHFDPKVIDYVIIHELAHLKHLDHSKAFWALVAKYDPKYKEHKKVLKNARY